MDSSPGRQAQSSAPTDDDIYTDSVISSRVSDASSDSGRGDYDENVACRWRTPEFYYQECSRYFDCPSHTIERDLSHEENTQAEEGLQADRDPPAGVSQAPGSPRSADSRTGSEPDEPSGREDPPDEVPPSTTDDESAAALDLLSLGQPRTALPTFQSPPPQESRRDEGLRPRSGSSRGPDEARPFMRARRGSQGQSSPALPPLPTDIGVDPTSPVQGGRRSGLNPRADVAIPSRTVSRTQPTNRSSPDVVLPRWQPDAEVTLCPICHSQFSFFVRKHHCRKCGRVVCGSCSPHRIIIPHQYIVRPPGEVWPPLGTPLSYPLTAYPYADSPPGGERVRLCNPCVPDPNPAPPQSPPASTPATSRPHHTRNRNSLGNAYDFAPSATSRHSVMYLPGASQGVYRGHPYDSSRTRSVTMFQGQGQGQRPRRPPGSSNFPYGGQIPSGSAPSFPGWLNPAGEGPSSSTSRQRMLPPTPRIAEEDECPVCHSELPSRSLPDFERRREAHVENCIRSHSLYGSPRRAPEADGAETAPQAPRRTGMYSYLATEKDCVDDAECTICFEEFDVGVQMARLECLCRFHRSCISAWFVNHPGRCPVHQHDGFGY